MNKFEKNSSDFEKTCRSYNEILKKFFSYWYFLT